MNNAEPLFILRAHREGPDGVDNVTEYGSWTIPLLNPAATFWELRATHAGDIPGLNFGLTDFPGSTLVTRVGNLVIIEAFTIDKLREAFNNIFRKAGEES